MDAFLGLSGLLAMLVGIVMLVISAIRKRTLRNWGLVAGGGLVLFVIGVSIGPSPSPEPKTVPTLATTSTSTPAPTQTQAPGPRFVGRPDAQPKDIELVVGESAVLEGLKLTLTGVERSVSIGRFIEAEAEKEFVIASIRLENVDTRTHSYNSFDFRIQTAGGQVLDRALETVEPRLGSGDLVTGGKVEGTVVFEVPREEGHQYILYKPNPFKADRIVIQIQ